MRPNQLNLRCYGERDGDLWVAVCIDLSLAAQGKSFEEARLGLHEQIREYVYDALVGEDKAHASELMARRSPASIQAKYYFYACLSSLMKAHQTTVKLFSELLPLQPAQPMPC